MFLDWFWSEKSAGVVFLKVFFKGEKLPFNPPFWLKLLDLFAYCFKLNSKLKKVLVFHACDVCLRSLLCWGLSTPS